MIEYPNGIAEMFFEGKSVFVNLFPPMVRHMACSLNEALRPLQTELEALRAVVKDGDFIETELKAVMREFGTRNWRAQSAEKALAFYAEAKKFALLGGEGK